tara:strand:- start:81 stop:449 length:369 start_codon:yes stop_codon:yes gene_type:complete
MFYFRHPKCRRVGNLDSRLDPETTGKWIIFGNRAYMGRLWKQTREMVKEGELAELKFTRTKNNLVDRRYALLVYADKDCKKNYYEILKGLDSNLHLRWISNEATRKYQKTKRKLRKFLDGLR